MKRQLLTGLLVFSTLYTFAQKKSPVKKSDPVAQLKNLVSKIDDRFKKMPAVLTWQDYSTSPSHLIFYKLQFESVESSFDVQTTNSLVTPYIGYMVLKLKVRSNATSGNVKDGDYSPGFSDSAAAKQNNNYQSCIDPKYNFNEWCIGDIKVLYAYQNGKWIFKSVDTEVPNKIANGTTRGDILERGVLNKLLIE
jgi:hypothetical protein